MMKYIRSFALSLLLLNAGIFFNACSSDGDSTPQSDAQVDNGASSALKVAGVQYSSGDYSHVENCDDDICGLSHFVREAATAGATIIATSEYSQDQDVSELSPAIGDNPATDARWEDGSITKSFSKLAAELNITLTFVLIVHDTEDANASLFNAAYAVGPDGSVLARHYKFQLFGSEAAQLTAGDNIVGSFFETPAGLAGLMICADAQCIVTGLTQTPDCTAHSIEMLKAYFQKEPKLIFFSAYWTVGGTSMWAALNVQKQVAVDGAVWLIAANNTQGDGKGGAIYDPQGTQIDIHAESVPGIVYGEIPTVK